MNGYREGGLHTECYSAYQKKQKGNSATCNNMDEPGEHYAEWDEDEYRMSTHNLVYVRNLEQWTHRSWGHSSGWGRRREDGEASSRQKVSGVQDQWIVEFYPTPQCLLTHNMVLSIKSMLSVLPTEQQNKYNNQRGRRKPSEVMPMSVTLMVGMI